MREGLGRVSGMGCGMRETQDRMLGAGGAACLLVATVWARVFLADALGATGMAWQLV